MNLYLTPRGTLGKPNCPTGKQRCRESKQSLHSGSSLNKKILKAFMQEPKCCPGPGEKQLECQESKQLFRILQTHIA